VIPLFLKMRETGVVKITDERMTRFWITLDQGVEFVLRALGDLQGGEIFVPRIPSMNIMDLSAAIAPGCRHEIVGIRAGEKLHEIMVPVDEAPNTVEYDTHYVIQPSHPFWDRAAYKGRGGKPVPAGFSYSSDTNTEWLTVDQIRAMAGISA
jgi:UDP-N-acetylglucosamine 4,6-dehydratase